MPVRPTSIMREIHKTTKRLRRTHPAASDDDIWTAVILELGMSQPVGRVFRNLHWPRYGLSDPFANHQSRGSKR